ncbi:hypothetical protein ZIOFF_045348 [Zingiber officinale]|uniref:40S ribosomal protein S27 n=1 Tax=Zingiber officinale TaxID=94328 RepID=A0A8J5FYE6_ZINOF|nr:hypothetical protein ZIOFF_045348 [Zingiber officinale]
MKDANKHEHGKDRGEPFYPRPTSFSPPTRGEEEIKAPKSRLRLGDRNEKEEAAPLAVSKPPLSVRHGLPWQEELVQIPPAFFLAQCLPSALASSFLTRFHASTSNVRRCRDAGSVTSDELVDDAKVSFCNACTSLQTLVLEAKVQGFVGVVTSKSYPEPSSIKVYSEGQALQNETLASSTSSSLPLPNDIDLLNPPVELEKRRHKLKRLVQSPNSFFMDVKCQGCFNITTVFSHSQTVVVCGNCQTVLCQPTGGRARLTEGCSFRRKGD